MVLGLRRGRRGRFVVLGAEERTSSIITMSVVQNRWREMVLSLVKLTRFSHILDNSTNFSTF